MRRAALIYNPVAGRRRHARVLDTILRLCRDQGFVIEPMPTSGRGQATRMAADLAAAGSVETVFALGGDGTAREVAAGLMGSPVNLGFLPGGTVNLMAMALGLPSDPVAAAAVLCQATPQRFDVGMAGGSPFLMMISAGLDALALATMDAGFKSRFGRNAVVLQGIREWLRYPFPPLHVMADGQPIEPASFVAVCNTPYYGGRYRMAPAARPDNGMLELVTFHGTGRSATLGFILDVVRGKHTARPDVRIRRVQEVEFALPPEAAVQVDGDAAVEASPLRVTIAATPLMVLAPSGLAHEVPA